MTQFFFDASASKEIREMLKIKNTKCPICDKEVDENNVGAFAKIRTDSGIRMVCNDYSCIMTAKIAELVSDG